MRSTIPSSLATAFASTPNRSCTRAPAASAHGACTRMPYGECSTMRQSPSSSRNRSTTRFVASGTMRVAARWSAMKPTRLDAARSSSPAVRARAAPASGDAFAISAMKPPIASPSSAGRPIPSPFQNGSRPGSPNAGATSTRSWVISWMRQLVAPSANTSPTRDS